MFMFKMSRNYYSLSKVPCPLVVSYREGARAIAISRQTPKRKNL